MAPFIFVTVAVLAVMLFPLAPAGAADGAASRETLRRARVIYEANCAVCHGLRGDGQGTAAHMFHSPPRDFRQALFKFRSTPSHSLPTDDDILKVITRGVRWTAMVGRADIAEPDRRAIVHYIKSFSPRFEQDRPLARIPVPLRPAESENLVRVGGQVYQKADCARCHGERARGDGPSGLGKDSWGQPIQASDLTWRPLKRGSVLEEIYLTIATGLSGTPMPAYGEALEKAQIWALVYYLDSIVPPERRLSGSRFLGEEQHGWMALRMQGTMGGGMTHAPMRSR